MILLGAIAGVHGVRGEVKVKSFTADPLAIATYGPLYDDDGRRFDLKITQKAAKDTVVIARIEGIADRNAAEALKGKRLYAPREALPAVEDESEFYAADLIGLKVEDRAGFRHGRRVGDGGPGADILRPVAHDVGNGEGQRRREAAALDPRNVAADAVDFRDGRAGAEEGAGDGLLVGERQARARQTGERRGAAAQQ